MTNLEKEQGGIQENISEQAEAPLTTPEKKSFLEIAKEKMASIGQRAESFIESGVSKFNQAKESVKFNSQKFIEKARDFDISFELGGIQDKTKRLAEDAKAKIQALIVGKKEEAPIEDIQEQQSEPVQEEVVPAKKFFGDNEEFSPEQALKDIRKLPREEQRKKLAEFKEKLAVQKQGLALLQEITIEAIKQNPDINIETLRKNIEESGTYIGMSKEQKTLTESLLNDFSEKNKKIKEVREQYPNDNDLYRALFGKDPDGFVQIVRRPFAFYIKIYNPDDYVAARFSGQKDIAEERKDRAKNSSTGCFLGGKSAIEGLDGSLIIENTDITSSAEETLEHEEQHAVKRIIGDKMRKIDIQKASSEIAAGGDPRKFWGAFVENNIADAQEDASDEILAYFKNGLPIEEIKSLFTESGGTYDFMGRVDERSDYVLNSDKFSEEPKRITREFLAKGRIRFFRSISLGVEAIDQLSKSFSKEEAINILAHEPFDKWPKVAKRMVEQKDKRIKFTT